MTDDTTPKRRGRPRVHATPEDARKAAIARATAHTTARRAANVEQAVTMKPSTWAKAQAIIERRGLGDLKGLVEVLVHEETERGIGT